MGYFKFSVSSVPFFEYYSLHIVHCHKYEPFSHLDRIQHPDHTSNLLQGDNDSMVVDPCILNFYSILVEAYTWSVTTLFFYFGY